MTEKQEIIASPSRYFATPMSLYETKELSEAEKLLALENWMDEENGVSIVIVDKKTSDFASRLNKLSEDDRKNLLWAGQEYFKSLDDPIVIFFFELIRHAAAVCGSTGGFRWRETNFSRFILGPGFDVRCSDC